MTLDAARQARYVREVQYGDGGNLAARISLHARFGTNRYGLHRWIFDHFDLPAPARVLELGCGLGFLWRQNADRIPASWQLVLTDFSRGMLTAARTWLHEADVAATYLVADAQRIPFATAEFDAVIANHMLYHVPNRPAALAEIRRVLRPGGRLYASTIGLDHLRQLTAIAGRAGIAIDLGRAARAFGIENGARQLAQEFAIDDREMFANDLVITEIEPVMAYIQSTACGKALSGTQLASLRAALAAEFARSGAIHASTSTGLFMCHANKRA